MAGWYQDPLIGLATNRAIEIGPPISVLPTPTVQSTEIHKAPTAPPASRSPSPSASKRTTSKHTLEAAADSLPTLQAASGLNNGAKKVVEAAG